MCGEFGFEPTPLKRPMPPGYILSGVGDETGIGYHWTLMASADASTWVFGWTVSTRLHAWRQAWRDFRSGGTDRTAREGPWPPPDGKDWIGNDD